MMPTLILHSLAYFVAFLVLVALVFAVGGHPSTVLGAEALATTFPAQSTAAQSWRTSC